MRPDPSANLSRIRLADDRRQAILRALVEFHRDRFDEELSDYRAGELLDFLLDTLGPTVYNQAIQDARAFMLARLDDLDAEFFRDEVPLRG